MHSTDTSSGKQAPKKGAAKSSQTHKQHRRSDQKAAPRPTKRQLPSNGEQAGSKATRTASAATTSDCDHTATPCEPQPVGQSASPGKQRKANAGKNWAKKKGSRTKSAGQAGTVQIDAIELSDADYSGRILPDADICTPPSLVDGAEVRRTLKLLIPPGQVTELRALEAKFIGDRSWPSVLSGYFDDAEKLNVALDTIDSAKGVYIILNSVNPALLARTANRIKRAGKGDLTGDRDIVARHWLMVDCDPVRPSGISATNVEHEAALARAMEVDRYLRSEGWSEPIRADSGNGGHLLYPIDLPVDDGGIVERCLKALDARLTDDLVKIDTSVFNPARIWKLYGTAACKGDHTPNRPHRMSRILSAPGENAERETSMPTTPTSIVPLELLESLAAEAPAESPTRPETNGQAHWQPFDIDAFIQRHGLEVNDPDPYEGGRRWTIRHSPMCEHHGDGPFLIQFANGALIAGCHHESCSWGWRDLRETFEPAAARRSGNRTRTSQRDAGRVDGAMASAPPPLTDLGNAERFVLHHGNEIRYVATWDKWLVWDGTRWALDTTRRINQRSKQTIRSMNDEVAKLAKRPNADVYELQRLASWAKTSEKRERISALIALAASESGIAIDHAVLDTDPWLLNCANGTVNLRTGELRPHDQADLITKTTGVDFPVERVAIPVWRRFLTTTFRGDRRLISFLRRLLGYSAAGVIQEHILPIFWGHGSNGKGTLLNAILDALGEYAIQAPRGFLMVKRGATHPTELTDLFGARFVAISETQDGQRLDEDLVKMLTGGDRLRARRMREDFWEFKPTHTPFLATNHKPAIRGTDHGIWRRLRLIPFAATFVDPSETNDHPGAPLKDRELPDKLKAELPGILRWIVRGCLAWQREGLNPPDTVLLATRAYRDASDTFGTWLADRCRVAPQDEVRVGSAYENYRCWCEAAGEWPAPLKTFTEKFEEAGFERLPRRHDGIYYRGVTLSAQPVRTRVNG